VGGALLALRSTGAITAAQYAEYAADYTAAVDSARRLKGTRHSELEAVIENVAYIAATGQLTASRLPVVFLTLTHNRQWWTTEPLLGNDERVSFPGSEIVWEHYPGQGIEIQWLATFGEANGYYLSGREDPQLRQLLGEVIPLASQRAGGIAWEYLFRFDGGSPPWTSALSQGTALQVLARAYARFHESLYLTTAQRALAIFEVAAPAGVRLANAQGTWYLQYTFAPNDLILNGFIQSLVGLYEYTRLTGETAGAGLFEAGDSEARGRVAGYNTGAWSHYDQFTESTLSYHELLAEFLAHLCERTQSGTPLAVFARESSESSHTSGGAHSGATERPGTSTTGASTASGGSPSAGGSAPSGPPTGSGGSAESGGSSVPAGTSTERTERTSAGEPIAGDQVYCTTAREFTADVHRPPTVALRTTSLPAASRGGVTVALSKVSTVTLTVRSATRVIWTNTATVEAGDPRLLWITPHRSGSYSVSLRAVDLAGNSASTSGTIAVHATKARAHRSGLR